MIKNEVLDKLVDEFNELNLKGNSFFDGEFDILSSGEMHYGDYFLVLNINSISSKNLDIINIFVNKYNSSLTIHPRMHNESLCLRISKSIKI